MYDGYKVYGPYLRKDGRKHVVLVNGHERKTVSYPKFLMERLIGRYLERDETVDHINENFSDDRVENLQILSRADNVKKSRPEPEMFEFICPECGIKVIKFMRTVRWNRKQGKSGPFCGRKCGVRGRKIKAGLR